MAFKKFADLINAENGKFATVHYGAEWAEFKARFHRNGEYQKGAYYHTDDRQDALSTAAHFINNN